MNKILVPVDFSDTSLNALSYAIQLFGSTETEFTILSTYELSSNAFHMKSMDNILEEDAQREMDTLLEKAQKEEPDISIKSKVVKSNPVTAITSMGNSGIYDFIVMGTKGASGLKEVFIGSVAGGVISKTEAPVLVVPGKYQYRPLQEIVFAISGIPFSNASVLEPLRKLAKMHSSKVNVVHVSEDKKQKPDLKEVISTIEDLDPSVTYAFGAGNVNEQLTQYLTKEDIELLCMLRSKKGFFGRIFTESVTLKQTFSSPIPLLILHDF